MHQYRQIIWSLLYKHNRGWRIAAQSFRLQEGQNAPWKVLQVSWKLHYCKWDSNSSKTISICQNRLKESMSTVLDASLSMKTSDTWETYPWPRITWLWEGQQIFRQYSLKEPMSLRQRAPCDSRGRTVLPWGAALQNLLTHRQIVSIWTRSGQRRCKL